MLKIGYINLYLMGYYHRLNKPGSTSLQAGDVYPSYAAAVDDIDQSALQWYLGTAAVILDSKAMRMGAFLDRLLTVNPAYSIPVALMRTRALHPGDILGMLRRQEAGRATLAERPAPAPAGGPLSVPAHKQTDPAKAPGQVRFPIPAEMVHFGLMSSIQREPSPARGYAVHGGPAKQGMGY